ncbi:MAG TPA: hypothetical protein PKE53_12695, partial [Flavobacteriales bacterium]|nr:hypothetical protein [Flavobacteriales bacterium]
MKYGNTKRCRSLLLGLAFTLGGGLATAQSIDPVVVTSMDIDLIQVPNQNRMAVKMRINNTDPVGYGGIVNTSFYIRWLTSSGATLGPRVNACTDGFNITNLTPVTDFGDGYTYRFYTSDNTGMYWDPNNHDDCLVPWFADGQWVTLFEIPVNNVSSCVEFQITNEGLAQQEGQEYYASAGGVELTGTVEPTVVQLGNCVVVDCPGLGLNIGDPCSDGDACTTGDAVTPSCECAGTFQDADGDLTCDANDGCPNDPNKVAAGVCGCGVADVDADSDGVYTCQGDLCDNDPLKTTPGACGCGVPDTDTDNDGTANCNDGCPNDPNKIAVGICGCGVADTDTDADGTADCVDPCPALANLENGDACDDGNPNTIGDVVTNCICAGSLPDDCEGVPGGPAQPGTGCDDNNACTINDLYDLNCNCAGTFQDTDSDGTCDANDGCPNDPNKIAAGICGCGVADTDTDADGTADCVD